MLELIKWVFPAATKAEFKKSMLDIIIVVYESNSSAELVQILNQTVKNGALFKQIFKMCSDSDEERGGSLRLKYVEQDGGRLLFEAGRVEQPIQTDFPPGTCQFCLWESPQP